VLIVIIFLLFLSYYNSGILFNHIGNLDPFWYVGIGLFYHISDYSNDYYKISRVPWNILEFLARQTLQPASAAFVLQALCYSTGSIALFFLFRDIFGKSKSFIISALYIFVPLLQASSAGADYHNTFSGAMFFLTLALLVRAILLMSKPSSFAAGAIAAAMLHTNPLFLLLSPMIALYIFVLLFERRRTARFVFQAAGLVLAGSISATILFSLVHASFGRDFLFFVPQIEYILWMQQKGHNVWWVPLSWEFLRNDTENAWLFSIFIICCVELIMTLTRQRMRQDMQASAANLGFIVAYVVALGYQLAGQTTLMPNYVSYPFLAATIIPVGYLLNKYVCTKPNVVIVYLAFPLLCAALLLLSREIDMILSLSPWSRFFQVVCVSATVYLLLILLSSTTLGIGLVLLPILNAVFGSHAASNYSYDTCHARRHLNVLIALMSQMATDLARKPQNVFVWFDRDDHAHALPCFDELKMAYLGGSFTAIAHNYFGDLYGPTQMNQFTYEQFAQLKATEGIIALLATRDTIKDQFIATAVSLGVDLRLAGLYQDRASGVKFYFFK
jgi:hypothetical protein